MFYPRSHLTYHDIHNAPGNKSDDINKQCQRYWIAEAIRYTHKNAVESIFAASPSSTTEILKYPEFPSVERLARRKTPHFGLSPILENEGTIDGTFKVIDKVFSQQLGLDPEADFHDRIYLVYGDQKTISLIHSVKKERQHSRNSYGRYRWLLPIPGLFHWRTNLIDMIYDVYGGSEPRHASLETTLLHNQQFMCCTIGDKSPFHHKEEVTTRSFDARITAMFYDRIKQGCSSINNRLAVDQYIAKLSPSTFLAHVEAIREAVFNWDAQQPIEATSVKESTIDHKFSAHCRFINHMITYKSLKYAIKHADIGIIERIFPRCCLLFHGSKKNKYAFLSLYMTWLTQKASSHELRTALLANGLVNIRGAHDGWFEMDRLNEFFNLQMKTIMATRRSSNQKPDDLFRRVALTASYCTNLKSVLESSFGEYSNGRHQIKDASEDVYRLAYELFKTRSVRKYAKGRELAFKPVDIIHKAEASLADSIEKFNSSQYGDGYLDDTAPAAPISELDDIMGEDSDGSYV